MRLVHPMPRYAAFLLAGAVALAVPVQPGPRAQEQLVDEGSAAFAEGPPARLNPTAHRPLPENVSQYWLVPDAGTAGRTAPPKSDSARTRFARGARLIASGDFAAGLPLIDTAALATTPLAGYGYYYAGVALIGLSRVPEADAAFAAASRHASSGYLSEGLAVRIADVALARLDAERAVDVLEKASDRKLSVPEEIYLNLGRALERAGKRADALKAYRRVYYDFPLSTQAGDAQAGIERLETADLIPPDRFKLQLARAEKLFAARRWAQARASFEALSRAAQGDAKELVALRLAECDYYLSRHRASRDALQPYLKGSSREAEARFFHLTATRALGDQATYVALARKLLEDHPEGSWAEETLNNLATHYILVDEDDEADRVFRELYRRFPKSRHAERAAWKTGWRSYRLGDYREAATIFESAAAAHPRADHRPAWLYWSGRARDQFGDRTVAADRYRLVLADYQNSYYGRLATRILASRKETPAPAVLPAVDAPLPEPVTTEALIRDLVAVELYDDALREVQYAQRVWGDSAQLQATVAYIRHNQGLALNATERFAALRGAINTMRRAYPQFMAAGGERMPPDILRVIFPLDFWPLIAKYSKEHNLDPYLIAALVAQESTFTPEIRSAANAYGLMQVIPGTGRTYARKLGLPYSTALLTRPEPNVRIGTLYFKDVAQRFGGAHFALASYNAGPHRVAAWLAEKPDLPEDEFIDDIPFPETQNYVKRILGTAEDYRRLYGGGILDPTASLSSRAPAAAAAPRAAPAAAKPAPKRPPSRPRRR